MKQCASNGCDSTNLIFSGIDAMMRGVPTETFCYDCGNRFAAVTAALAEIE